MSKNNKAFEPPLKLNFWMSLPQSNTAKHQKLKRPMSWYHQDSSAQCPCVDSFHAEARTKPQVLSHFVKTTVSLIYQQFLIERGGICGSNIIGKDKTKCNKQTFIKHLGNVTEMTSFILVCQAPFKLLRWRFPQIRISTRVFFELEGAVVTVSAGDNLDVDTIFWT